MTFFQSENAIEARQNLFLTVRSSDIGGVMVVLNYHAQVIFCIVLKLANARLVAQITIGLTGGRVSVTLEGALRIKAKPLVVLAIDYLGRGKIDKAHLVAVGVAEGNIEFQRAIGIFLGIRVVEDPRLMISIHNHLTVVDDNSAVFRGGEPALFRCDGLSGAVLLEYPAAQPDRLLPTGNGVCIRCAALKCGLQHNFVQSPIGSPKIRLQHKDASRCILSPLGLSEIIGL